MRWLRGRRRGWGDGQSAPHLIDAEAAIDTDLFDPPVSQDLNDFFRSCFQNAAAP